MNAKVTTILLLLALILSPPLAYAGGYYANVRRTYVIGCGAGPVTCEMYVEYRYANKWSSKVFAPAHSVDKVIRPWYWEE